MDYLQPNSFEQTPAEAQPDFIPYAQRQNVGAGAEWISGAWRLFRPKVGMWMVLMVLALLGSALLAGLSYFVPGSEFVQFLLTPVFMGGVMLLCDHQYRTGEFDLGLVLRPFKTHIAPLLGVGLVLAAFLLVTMLLLFGLLMVLVGFDFLMGLFDPSEASTLGFNEMLASPGTMLSFFAVFYVGLFVVIVLYYALLWFSPAVIVLHDVPLGNALKMSLMAVKKNLLPGLVYFVLVFLLTLACMIPLMMTVFFVPVFILLLIIVMLVLSPVMMISMYTAYRSLFLREG